MLGRLDELVVVKRRRLGFDSSGKVVPVEDVSSDTKARPPLTKFKPSSTAATQRAERPKRPPSSTSVHAPTAVEDHQFRESGLRSDLLDGEQSNSDLATPRAPHRG